MDIWISVLIAAVGAIMGAGASRIFSMRKERFERTMDIYRTYHSPEMTKARNVAWSFLATEFAENPRPFHELFSDQPGAAPEYDSLAQVIYYWYMIGPLAAEGAISKRLARRLLKYPFRYWYGGLQPLYVATKRAGHEEPDWFEMMESDEWDWLK